MKKIEVIEPTLNLCKEQVKKDIAIQQKYFSKNKHMDTILLELRKGYIKTYKEQEKQFNKKMFDALNEIEKEFLYK